MDEKNVADEISQLKVALATANLEVKRFQNMLDTIEKNYRSFRTKSLLGLLPLLALYFILILTLNDHYHVRTRLDNAG